MRLPVIFEDSKDFEREEGKIGMKEEGGDGFRN